MPKCKQSISYHGERHFVDFIFVFRFLLPEWTMPEIRGKEIRIHTKEILKNLNHLDEIAELEFIQKKT